MIEGPHVIEAVSEAAEYRIGLTITVEHLNQWLSFRSRMISFVDGMLLLEMPLGIEGIRPVEFLPSRDCTINFKLKNYRYFFNAKLSEAGRWPTDDGKEIDILGIGVPNRIERLERRAFARIDVPSHECIRACIWATPTRQPAWSGSVTNLSAGGFQLRTNRTALDYFEVGDTVSADIWLSPESEPLSLDAYFRHGTPDGQMALLGMEFSSIYNRPEGREIYQKILDRLDTIAQATGLEQ